MNADSPIEGRAGLGRVEAFSDGVIAILITIMVLELKAPVADGRAALVALWPTVMAYALSYLYIAIYWINHHRLFSHARRVTGGLLWANITLLFALSLVPFATSYLGEHRFSAEATLFYVASLIFPSIAYVWLQLVVRKTGTQDPEARRYHRATTRKGFTTTAIYVIGLLGSFFSPVIGIACAALVTALWIVPWGPLDRLFLGRDEQVTV